MEAGWAPYSYRCHTSGDNTFPYDMILRYEDNLRNGLKTIFDIARYDKTNLNLTLDNPSSGEILQAYFPNGHQDTSLLEKVARIYNDDIVAFSYKFPWASPDTSIETNI